MNKWSRNVNIYSDGMSIESQLIQYLHRIFQGDSLSLLLFNLCVNPLSYLLNKLQGYHMGKNRNKNRPVNEWHVTAVST